MGRWERAAAREEGGGFCGLHPRLSFVGENLHIERSTETGGKHGSQAASFSVRKILERNEGARRVSA